MSDHTEFLDDYFARYRRALLETDVRHHLHEATEVVRAVRDRGAKLILAGNGGSAAMTEHAAIDFTKQGGVRAMTLSSPATITALANDYGYEHWVARGIELYADSGDAVILVSTSGRSPNIVHAGETALKSGLPLITFSGHAADNPLRALGGISFWLDSRAYNVVENTHQIWLLTICDLLIGKAEYSVS